jgi:hypothetical protein
MATARILLAAAGIALFAGVSPAASAQACDSRSDPSCRPAQPAAAKLPQRITSAQPTRSVPKTSKAQSKPRRSGTVSHAVMSGESSIALIARLPWWRADEPHLLRARMNREAESQVLVAADAWLTAFTETRIAAGSGERIALASADGLDDMALAGETPIVVDAGELNEIDLTAAEAPGAPAQSWLQVVLALLGGAFAAAGTARFVLV